MYPTSPHVRLHPAILRQATLCADLLEFTYMNSTVKLLPFKFYALFFLSTSFVSQFLFYFLVAISQVTFLTYDLSMLKCLWNTNAVTSAAVAIQLHYTQLPSTITTARDFQLRWMQPLRRSRCKLCCQL